MNCLINDMSVVGITGYIGSGKSLVCEIISLNFNVIIISTDIVAKEIINNNEEFSWLLKKNGVSLNEEENKIVIEKLHPMVWEKVKKTIKEIEDEKKVILVETALPSKKFFEICDWTILIKNNIEIKNKLLKQNRNYTTKVIDDFIDSQKKYEIEYNKCDFVFENNYDKNMLQENIIEIFSKKILKVEKNEIY